MKYLKRIRSTKETYRAEFTSGATTASHDVSCFFMVMSDKGVEPAGLEPYIKLGEKTDPGHDWCEIRRIAATFIRGAAA
ncbi:MAG TPA: hypothetical protein VHW09_27055 [Bryobacteraceae bacterium]|jgi:hypothetical protein|nr:hypothetical protein [Bryobacteraceae bacterium]